MSNVSLNLYASLTYLIISRKAGLLPYMRRNTRNILAVSHMVRTIEPIRIIRLSAISQAEIVCEASLIMEATGLVSGKKVKALDTAPWGLLIKKWLNQRGHIAGSVNIVVQPCPSLAVAPIEPMPALMQASRR